MNILTKILIISITLIVFEYLFMYIGNKLKLDEILIKKIDSKSKKALYFGIGMILISVIQLPISSKFGDDTPISLIIFTVHLALLMYLVILPKNKK